MIKQILRLKELNEHVQMIIKKENISDENKYKLIFHSDENKKTLCEKIDDCLKELNIEKEESYSFDREDRVINFAQSIKEITNSLLNIFTEEEIKNYKEKEKLLMLIYKMDKIVNSEIDEKLKYNLVFSKNISDKIYKIFKELNISFDYYDPDSSYEEDVLAFYQAVKSYA